MLSNFSVSNWSFDDYRMVDDENSRSNLHILSIFFLNSKLLIRLLDFNFLKFKIHKIKLKLIRFLS